MAPLLQTVSHKITPIISYKLKEDAEYAIIIVNVLQINKLAI